MARFTQADIDRINTKNLGARNPNALADSKPVTDEGELHNQIESECIRRRWYFVHSRMDRPSTQAKGVTDFIIALSNGVTIWCECKAKNGKLSQEQFTTMHVLKSLGHFHCVVYSFADFIQYVDSYAKI